MKPPQSDLIKLADANELPAELADDLLALGQEAVGEELPAGTVAYEVGAKIGAGGMGSVVAARHPAIRRDVAMKLLAPGSDEATRLRFVAEAQITGQLEHPNIVPVHELAIDEHGRPYYTMKLVRGTTVAAILDRLAREDAEAIERFSLVALLTIFQKICDAVAFAHSRGVIHRDLKPANVMVGDYGEVMVMDWGVAKVLDRAVVSAVGAVKEPVSTARCEAIGAGDTVAGMVMGTPHYMAPEQARAQHEAVDERADIYSLGAILFHLLKLRPPVDGDTAREVIGKVALGQIERMPASGIRRAPSTAPGAETHPHLPGKRIPSSLAAVVRRAMSFRPEHRYASVPELQREIAAYQLGFATEAEEASVWKHCALFVGRHQTATAVAAIGLALVVAVSAGSMVNVVRERNRAEQAIENLRRNAPHFLDQSRVLASQQHFFGALAKIDTAILCVPERADFHAQRGNVLQVLRRFDEAVAAYQQVLVLDARFPYVRENIALSAKLATLAKEGPLPQAALVELDSAWRRQGRAAEAFSVAAELHVPIREQLPLLRERLRLWLGVEPALTLGADESLTLALTGQPITDIAPLRGLPVTRLHLDSTQVRDLSPLAGMPLEELRLNNTPVSDLTPLRGMLLKVLRLSRCADVEDLGPLAGMPLEELNIAGAKVTDLRPLVGMSLRILYMSGTTVSDLSPLQGMKLEIFVCGSREAPIVDIGVLRGMPLRSVSFAHAVALEDLSPLEGCRELEEIFLPPNPGDVTFLRRLPRLKHFIRRNSTEGEVHQTAAEFWANYDRKLLREAK